MARRIGMYFAWDRTAEASAPLGDLNNRLPALFELRRQFWPRYEALAEAPGGQHIDGFLRAVFMQNFALFGEQAAKATGMSVDHMERRHHPVDLCLRRPRRPARLLEERDHPPGDVTGAR